MAAKDPAAARAARQKMMLEDPLIKVVPIIAFPMIIQFLVNSIYGIADTYFVSQLGTAATAAIGVNDALTHFTQSVAMGFGAGASSYISRLLGGRKDEDASRVATTTLFTCMGFMVALVVVCYLFMSPIVDLLGATATSKHYSMDYARFILLGAPFTGATFVLSQMLRAEGSTLYSMIGTVSGCVVNIALDPLLISVMGLEVAGAAIATTISKVISVTVLLVPFLTRRSILEIKPRFFTPKWHILREVLRMGIPTFLRSSCMSVATTVVNNVAKGFGDYALAAVSVSNKTMRFVDAVVMGFSQGIQPVVGFCWGAKDYKRVKEAIRFIFIVGGALSLAIGLGVSLFTPQIISWLTGGQNGQTVDMGAELMRSQCYVLPLHMSIMIASGLFQALGRATSATVLGLSRSLIVLVPCVLIMPLFMGEAGLTYARAAADALSFLVIALPLLIKLVRDITRTMAQAKEQTP